MAPGYIMRMNNYLDHPMKYLFPALTLLLLYACSKDDHPGPIHSILLLQVDYMTCAFEGGKEIPVASIHESDSLPIEVAYQSPGDFGGISLYYQPTEEMIFSGTIVWMGTGQISYPLNFEPADVFRSSDADGEQPDQERFQIIFFQARPPIEYNKIWAAIDGLDKVREYMVSGYKIGLFLYTPSVGVGDPYEWDWFVIMLK